MRTTDPIEERARALALARREEEGHYVHEYEDGIDLAPPSPARPIIGRRIA